MEVTVLGRYNFKNACKVLSNENRIILVNRDTGGWLKISKQCYDILKIGIENNFTEEEVLNNLADDEDRHYFTSLFSKIKELDVIYDINEGDINTNKIDTFYFALTNRCNLDCLHCSVDAQFIGGDDYFNTEQIFRIINKIKEYSPKNIVFTGGEPLIRRDFIEILKHTSRGYSGNISLMTNGTLVNQENVKVLSLLLDHIDISMDGVDEETCSVIRGRGVFEKVINSVKLLQDNKFEKITLSMVLTKNNEPYMERFKKLNGELKTKPIIRAFMALGRGKTNRDKLMADVSKTPEGKPSLNNNQINREIRACSCGAGCKEIFINYDGMMYPCNLLTGDEYRIGCINDIEAIRSCFQNLDYKLSTAYKALCEIQPDIYHKCKECNVNLFCWTCLAELDRFKENDEIFNRKCIDSKRHLTMKIWS